MGKRIVIALGGNALGNTPYEQLSLVTETAKPIVDLIAQGNEVVIVPMAVILAGYLIYILVMTLRELRKK